MQDLPRWAEAALAIGIPLSALALSFFLSRKETREKAKRRGGKYHL